MNRDHKRANLLLTCIKRCAAFVYFFKQRNISLRDACFLSGRVIYE